MKGLGIGRIVHYVMADGEHRPAIVVRIWDKSTGYINLQVFTDGANDRENINEIENVGWASSVPYSEEGKVLTWHWPEHVD